MSFSFFWGWFSKNLMHYWKSLIISSTLGEFKGVNEKWKQMGNWFNDKLQCFYFMYFSIAFTEYLGWSNPIQQIFGSPNTLNPRIFSYFANFIVAKFDKYFYLAEPTKHFFDILPHLISSYWSNWRQLSFQICYLQILLYHRVLLARTWLWTNERFCIFHQKTSLLRHLWLLIHIYEDQDWQMSLLLEDWILFMLFPMLRRAPKTHPNTYQHEQEHFSCCNKQQFNQWDLQFHTDNLDTKYKHIWCWNQF